VPQPSYCLFVPATKFFIDLLKEIRLISTEKSIIVPNLLKVRRPLSDGETDQQNHKSANNPKAMKAGHHEGAVFMAFFYAFSNPIIKI